MRTEKYVGVSFQVHCNFLALSPGSMCNFTTEEKVKDTSLAWTGRLVDPDTSVLTEKKQKIL